MNPPGQSQWQHHLRRGHYLGEISALCFLHIPNHLSSLLLAGTGSQILVYDLVTGKIVKSFEVFDGIRVHGISLDNFRKQFAGNVLDFRVAVFGERRVKIFTLRVRSEDDNCRELELTLVHSLPKFGHWVMDVCFLKDGTGSSENARYLAVGCSDNAVCFWDTLRRDVFSEVKCTERCLLYSMRMLGIEIESLCIASGTIFNEIVVWKVVSQNHASLIHGNHAEDHLRLTTDDDFRLPGPKYKDVLISRLVGHEGSIFRISWFPNGLKLVSVSDDRSARIWEVKAENGGSGNTLQDGINQFAGPVLFGHNARIWDCCIFDSIIITAGEDCTCRVWDHDGRELKEIKEHSGRGVWRCLYDPISSLLVTAGFDSAIKIHKLLTSSEGLEGTLASENFSDRQEDFALSLPNSSGQGGLMDSKSEYVRCLHFSREDSLYVATNNGYLYHASLLKTKEGIWTELARVTEDAPIICMDVISECSNSSGGFEDWIAVGDGKGSMTICHVVGSGRHPKVDITFTWLAEKERHLLGTYWCNSLGNRFIFTADPGGKVKLWKLYDNFPSASPLGKESYDVFLIANYNSCFGMRIMCVDASFDEELLVCGDIRGNLLLFSLPRDLLSSTSIAAEVKASPMTYFKGAHGVSSVSSVSIAGLCTDQVEICSTGADGCICYLQHKRDLLDLEFIGMKQVKDLSAIRSVFTSYEHSDVGNYAVGFASENFIIWNLSSGTKVTQITCGGWRRPHSYYLGHLPEMMYCFSFVKDDIIYIYRHWVAENGRQIYPRTLHLQFHGREIHSLCFISARSLSGSDEKHGLASGSSWIATGSEDGIVRLTRFEPGTGNWLSSQNLGEHVGGSAVRSICSVSKIHIFNPGSVGMPNVVNGQKEITEDVESPFILISAGAKRVVTAWKQMITIREKRVGTLCSARENGIRNNLSVPGLASVSSLSFQWLSTDMPLKQNSNVKRKSAKVLETAENSSMARSDAVSVGSLSSECKKIESSLSLDDNNENDWRYLDVTAFLVKEAGSRISVSFVVIASSDATVMLRALVLPFRLWFDVASLAPLASPVLSLQHVVIPKLPPSRGSVQIGNLYLAITGLTDGSISIWNLTESVESFMLRISCLKMENYVEFQKRPRTGRGSQGGRWWRSLDSHSMKKKPSDGRLPSHFSSGEKTDNGSVSVERTESGSEVENDVCRTMEASLSGKSHSPVRFQVDDQASVVSKGKKDDLLPETSVLVAMHVLNNVHQSGVNCLYVSDVKHLSSDSRFSFFVVTGGDDQAISCLRFDLEINPIKDKPTNSFAENPCTTTLPARVNNYQERCLVQNHWMHLLLLDKIESAHSSAVKGVWTDGIWVFSVGLDQRVRCWSRSCDKLVESAHLIISVPEPEALDAKNCGGNHYQIAVAGRGMQMVEFRPSNG